MNNSRSLWKGFKCGGEAGNIIATGLANVEHGLFEELVPLADEQRILHSEGEERGDEDLECILTLATARYGALVHDQVVMLRIVEGPQAK